MREVFMTPTGETLRTYCKNNNLKYTTVWQRIKKSGMTFTEAVATPTRTGLAPTPEQEQFYIKCRKAKVNPALVMIRHKRSGESLDKSIRWYERRNKCLKTLRY